MNSNGLGYTLVLAAIMHIRIQITSCLCSRGVYRIDFETGNSIRSSSQCTGG